MAPESLHSDGSPSQLQSMKKAIVNFQEFIGLKRTGILDEETIEMMKRPRCGNPDKVRSPMLLFRSKGGTRIIIVNL